MVTNPNLNAVQLTSDTSPLVRYSKMEEIKDKIQKLTMSDQYSTYKLGNFKLKSGGEIPDALIAYKTFGDPSQPAIIYPSWYSGCTLRAHSKIVHV